MYIKCLRVLCRAAGQDMDSPKARISPPSAQTDFKKWVRAIPTKDKYLDKKSYICHSHFSEDLIIKVDTFIIMVKQLKFLDSDGN